MLLEEKHLLKEERDRARKLSRGIQGFGSLSQRSTPAQSILRQTSSSSTTFSRCNSDFNSHETEKCPKGNTHNFQEDLGGLKENMAPEKEESHPLVNDSEEDSRVKIFMEEQEDDHPFNSTEMHANASLLSARDGILQGC